jgi:hypothetical protein
MKIKEILNEIGMTSICPKLNWNPSLIQYTEHFSNIEGHEILKLTDKANNFFIIVDAQNELQAYIATEKTNEKLLPLVRLENISGIGGLATMIVVSLIASGLKFVIKDTEKLTYSGLRWLIKIIKKNGAGLNLKTQTGEIPTVKLIQAEWNKSFDDFNSDNSLDTTGPTSIFIENKSIDVPKLNEDNNQWNDNRLLKPYYHYFKNDELL